jgi:hypothetical protein
LTRSEVLASNAALQQQVYGSRRPSPSSSASPHAAAASSTAAAPCGASPISLSLSNTRLSSSPSLCLASSPDVTAANIIKAGAAAACSSGQHRSLCSSGGDVFMAAECTAAGAWTAAGCQWENEDSGDEEASDSDEEARNSDEEASPLPSHPAARFTLRAPPTAPPAAVAESGGGGMGLVSPCESPRMERSGGGSGGDKSSVVCHNCLDDNDDGDDGDHEQRREHHQPCRTDAAAAAPCDALSPAPRWLPSPPSKALDGTHGQHQQQSDPVLPMEQQLAVLQAEVLALQCKGRAHTLEREGWMAAAAAAAEVSAAELLAKQNQMQHEQELHLQKEMRWQQHDQEKTEALVQCKLLLLQFESDAATAAAAAAAAVVTAVDAANVSAAACMEDLKHQLHLAQHAQQQLAEQQQQQAEQHAQQQQALAAALVGAAAAEAATERIAFELAAANGATAAAAADAAAAFAAAAASEAVVDEAQGKVEQVMLALRRCACCGSIVMLLLCSCCSSLASKILC